MTNRLKYIITGVIIVLILIILFAVTSRKSEKPASEAQTQVLDTIATQIQEKDEPNVSEKNPNPIDTIAQSGKKNISDDPPALTDDVLAIVDNQKITKKQLDSMLNIMPAQIKEYYKDDKPEFLEELITRQLLISEAKKQKIDQQEDFKEYAKQNPDKKEDIMANLLLRKIANSVTISEQELKDFFNQYKDQLPNKDYESVKEQLRPMAIEEKQRQTIDDFINVLKTKAKIVRNENWIKEQERLAGDNPLSKVSYQYTSSAAILKNFRL